MRPLVFLDIDGVINDFAALAGFEVGYEFTTLKSGSYIVYIPDYMPNLIQDLTGNAEVMWLSTWRELANDDIAPALGIDSLPTISDGCSTRNVKWKPRAALPFAEKALEEGREVWWIEDFYREIPLGMPLDRNMFFVDTAEHTSYPVLKRNMMPRHLLGL